jgi:hypothetical protein
MLKMVITFLPNIIWKSGVTVAKMGAGIARMGL